MPSLILSSNLLYLGLAFLGLEHSVEIHVCLNESLAIVLLLIVLVFGEFGHQVSRNKISHFRT